MRLTYGRHPTYDEIKSYYTRNDVLEFINDAAGVRKIVLSFRDEPSIRNERGTPPLKQMGVDALREYLLAEFTRVLPESDYPGDEALNAYPSFHFLTKGVEGESGDFIMEADCPGWRRSFVDVRGAVEFLHEYHVPFMAKFSGHRSLHIIIQREAFPQEFRERPLSKNWGGLDKELRTFFSRYAMVRRAHGTGGLLRLPYSLNENTGMVSLPIPYKEIDSFRPWVSFHHLVSIRKKLSKFTEECRRKSDNVGAFLDAALVRKSVKSLPRRIWSFSLARKMEFAEIDVERNAEAAWHNLAMGTKPDDEVIARYRDEINPDIRWFIAESLIGDARSFELLPENDEYALCAIQDSIAHQANSSINQLFDRFRNLSDYRSIGGLQAVLERIEPKVLNQELIRRSKVLGANELRNLIRFAIITSSTFNEWEFSEKVIQNALERFPDLLDVTEIKMLEALHGLEGQNIEAIRVTQDILFKAGERATQHLLLAMISSKGWVRRRALEVIVRLKDKSFAECLINALADENGRIRKMAMSAVIELGEAMKAHLDEAANSDHPILRANAIRALGIIVGKSSISTAISALNSTNIDVKIAAIKSLIQIHDESALEALGNALWDSASDVSLKAAYALASFGEAGKRILKDAFAQARIEEKAQAARCIAHGLVKAGDESGLDLMAEALYDEFWGEWLTPLTIARLGHPRGNDIIVDFFKNAIEKPEMSFPVQPAINALSEINDSRAMPLLLEFLKNRRDKRTLKQGVNILRLKGKEAAPTLLQMVHGDNYSLAQRAASALMKIGQNAMPEIEHTLAEMEPDSKPWKLLNSVYQSLNPASM